MKKYEALSTLGILVVFLGFIIDDPFLAGIGVMGFGAPQLFCNKHYADDCVEKYPEVNYLFVRILHYLTSAAFVLFGLAGLYGLIKLVGFPIEYVLKKAPSRLLSIALYESSAIPFEKQGMCTFTNSKTLSCP